MPIPAWGLFWRGDFRLRRGTFSVMIVHLPAAAGKGSAENGSFIH
jgi:hypothetical protein